MKGKVCIVATEMLKSMCKNSRPTKAELTDVSTAVFDGADAVWLSDETTIGAHPDLASQYLGEICGVAEKHYNEYAIASRVKTLIPGVNYSGYSWKDNEFRKFDVLKMKKLNEIVQQCEYNNILIKLLNCNMYVAKVTKPISRVNYIYEDNSIYFDEELNLNKLSDQMIHECIHYLQDYRNMRGNLDKIGLFIVF